MLSDLPLHKFCSYENLTLYNRQFFYDNEKIKIKCIIGYRWIKTIYYQCIDGEWLPPNTDFYKKGKIQYKVINFV